MLIPLGCIVGFVAWFLIRYLVAGLYTVNQNERAVKTSFGRAERVGKATTLEDPTKSRKPTPLRGRWSLSRSARTGRRLSQKSAM